MRSIRQFEQQNSPRLIDLFVHGCVPFQPVGYVLLIMRTTKWGKPREVDGLGWICLNAAIENDRLAKWGLENKSVVGVRIGVQMRWDGMRWRAQMLRWMSCEVRFVVLFCFALVVVVVVDVSLLWVGNAIMEWKSGPSDIWQKQQQQLQRQLLVQVLTCCLLDKLAHVECSTREVCSRCFHADLTPHKCMNPIGVGWLYAIQAIDLLSQV